MSQEIANGKIIQVRDLKKHFAVTSGFFAALVSRRPPRTLKAVDGIGFDIGEGETVGLAGESGCGKTTTAKIMVRLYEPSEGEILFQGENIAHLQGAALKRFRRHAQMVFQDPYESLNPRFTVAGTVEEPLIIHGTRDPDERIDRVARALEIAGLRPVADYLDRYPHELSGGQRQRVAIARALVLGPKFVVADEPVSMLDVSIRAGVLNLLRQLTIEMGLASLYISHDLSLIRYMCDRTAIMYLGRIVEMGPTERLIRQPQHPYTQVLLSVVPTPDPERAKEPLPIEGEVPSPIDLPTGCRFHPRCYKAMDICRQAEPPRIEVAPNHVVECHLYR